MKERIPLQVVEDRLVITAVVECRHLRVRRQVMRFVIDTGSSDSFLSANDVKRLQIPVKGRTSQGVVDFGGSRFDRISLPKFTLFLLKEDNQKNDYLSFMISLSALKITKVSPGKVLIAEMLPSILGMDFLKEQKLSLHIFASEGLAFLECC